MTDDTFKFLATSLLILSCGLDVIHCCSKAPEPEPTKLKCFHKTNNPDGQKGPCCEREYKPSVTDHEEKYPITATAIMYEAMDSNFTNREPEGYSGPFKAGKDPIPITGITGTLKFSYDGKKVTVTGNVSNVPYGQHGFHIHTKPFSIDEEGLEGPPGRAICRESGPHYNPHTCTHGRPDAKIRHVGDIGNIYSTDSNGTTVVNVEDSIINMKKDGGYGKDGDMNSILGRTVVIHQLPDFYNSSSIGPRIACGVIKLDEN